MGKYIEEIYNIYISERNEEIADCPEKEREISLEFGDIIYFCYKNKPIYAVYLGMEDQYYMFAKVSEWWELGNKNDMLVFLDDEPFIIETWNIFYLTEEEIKKARKMFVLSYEDKEILKKVIFENERIPEHKRMSEIPDIDTYPQVKFHRLEASDVKELALRVFDMLEEENVIELAPERLEEQLLAASEENEYYKGKNFDLFYYPEENYIELIPSDDLIGKAVVIKVFDEEYKFDKLPKNIILEIPQEFNKKVNIDYIGEKIDVREIQE
ncbi:hypothetical protein JCM14244_07920 [Venenivibrio stagnispumantis]|uniref:Uncharacterized protein n=1 Tax=Venenivibrio stagnispumantis TaxID=407998 RepID=A0AA45WNU0_9AQUI|nr:hypothetical protein [Venenivibrio stagnispumantis]MCW4573981.1 hypothetical protein [Venenivibrio stagnispumantis]SMP19295.1 hypothetical protein SAMN06264868_11910 [Venenivibrio stagnispumantis]